MVKSWLPHLLLQVQRNKYRLMRRGGYPCRDVLPALFQYPEARVTRAVFCISRGLRRVLDKLGEGNWIWEAPYNQCIF